MTDSRIAGRGFHVCHGDGMRAADQCPLNPAMLVSQRDLQVEDRFAVTLETEVPRFDNAGMYRTDCYFMDFRALHPVEFSHARQDDVVFGPFPGIMSRPAGALVANRFEPRVVFDRDAALLGNLPFEQMRLGAGGGRNRAPPGAGCTGADTGSG